MFAPKTLDAKFLSAQKLSPQQNAMLLRLIATKDANEHDLWAEHDAIVNHAENTSVCYADALRVIAFIYDRFPIVRVIDRPLHDAVEFRGLLLCDHARSYVWCSIYLSNNPNDENDTCIADENFTELMSECL